MTRTLLVPTGKLPADTLQDSKNCTTLSKHIIRVQCSQGIFVYCRRFNKKIEAECLEACDCLKRKTLGIEISMRVLYTNRELVLKLQSLALRGAQSISLDALLAHRKVRCKRYGARPFPHHPIRDDAKLNNKLFWETTPAAVSMGVARLTCAGIECESETVTGAGEGK